MAYLPSSIYLKKNTDLIKNILMQLKLGAQNIRVLFFSPSFFVSFTSLFSLALCFGFLKSCPPEIRHHFTVYYFRGKASSVAAAPCMLLIIHINSVEWRKNKVKWDGVVMKEGEIARLEDRNIGGERKQSSEERERRNLRGVWAALERKRNRNRNRMKKREENG